jgi:hypothetical protein
MIKTFFIPLDVGADEIKLEFTAEVANDVVAVCEISKFAACLIDVSTSKGGGIKRLCRL